MPGKNIFDNLKKMDTSYLLDPSLQEELQAEDISVDTDKPHEIDINSLVHFKKHPFHIDKESSEFLELVDSIRENGIIQPVLVRPLPDGDGKYEIISGHCRTEAARVVGLQNIPIVVVSVDDYTATKLMTHSNISGRDEILPSEKAKAYRMCLDEEKKLGKNRTDTAETIGAGKDSKRQVQRFVRLSYLSDDLLTLIDVGKLTIQIGTELAFLDPESQASLYEYIANFHQIPNLVQAKIIREEAGKQPLSYEKVISLLVKPPKESVKTKVTFKTKDLADYFEQGTSADEMESIIKQLLIKYKEGGLKLEENA